MIRIQFNSKHSKYEFQIRVFVEDLIEESEEIS